MSERQVAALRVVLEDAENQRDEAIARADAAEADRDEWKRAWGIAKDDATAEYELIAAERDRLRQQLDAVIAAIDQIPSGRIGWQFKEAVRRAAGAPVEPPEALGDRA